MQRDRHRPDGENRERNDRAARDGAPSGRLKLRALTRGPSESGRIGNVNERERAYHRG
jgi:hypothetical protein